MREGEGMVAEGGEEGDVVFGGGEGGGGGPGDVEVVEHFESCL